MTVVDRAAALVPMLAERAPKAEQARRVSDESFDALSKAGVFLMTAPISHSGAHHKRRKQGGHSRASSP